MVGRRWRFCGAARFLFGSASGSGIAPGSDGATIGDGRGAPASRVGPSTMGLTTVCGAVFPTLRKDGLSDGEGEGGSIVVRRLNSREEEEKKRSNASGWLEPFIM